MIGCRCRAPPASLIGLALLAAIRHREPRAAQPYNTRRSLLWQASQYPQFHGLTRVVAIVWRSPRCLPGALAPTRKREADSTPLDIIRERHDYYERHTVLLLQTSAPTGACCADKGAQDMRDYAKEAREGARPVGPGKVRVKTQGGLLTHARKDLRRGLPEAVWYTYVAAPISTRS